MENQSKRLLLAGGTGLIGNELGLAFARAGWSVTVLSRSPQSNQFLMSYPCDLISWDQLGDLSPADFDCLINLAGASIFETSWNEAGQKKLMDSRIQPIHRLAKWLGDKKIPLYFQASATGYYGDQGQKTLDDSNDVKPDPKNFLVRCSIEWEKAAQKVPAERRVTMRIPPVLSLQGGMLATLDPLFSNGLAALTARKEQWFSWIHIDDLVGMVLSCAEGKLELEGTCHFVAPQPVFFDDFHHALLDIKQTFSFPRVPATLIKAGMWNGKWHLLLDSVRAMPSKALSAGYTFRYPDIRTALEALYTQDDKRHQSMVFQQKQWLPWSLDKTWEFFSEANNLETLTPAWLNFHVMGKSDMDIQAGTRIDYRLKLRGIPLRWKTHILEWEPKRSFVDTQEKGPYKLWHHTHRFEEVAGGTLVEDLVFYKLPFSYLGSWVGGFWVRSDVTKIFGFRAEKLRDLVTVKKSL